jgi:hypothetical protein
LASPGVEWPYQWTRDYVFYFHGVSGSNDIAMLSSRNLAESTPLQRHFLFGKL